jgi:Tfp pilus assembly protein PilF
MSAGSRLAAALFLVGAAAMDGRTLLPVPPVDVSAMEPAVRQQVEAARQSLAAVPGLPAPEAAARFGEAGQIFLLYALLAAATPCFENAAALAPRDFRWAYYAGIAAQGRDVERARERFQRAAALHSPFPTAQLRLGEVEILRGDLESASRAFTAALAFPDTAPAAHFGLGRVALQRGDARLAAEHLEAALAAQPEASIVHAPLAIAYRRLGQLDKAQAQAAARGNQPVRFPDALMNQVQAANAGNMLRIATATNALRQGRVAEAAEELRQAIAVDPEDLRAWLNLGIAEERLGDVAAAEKSYRRAVEIDPDSARARYNLGTLLAAHGARGEAIGQLQAAVRLQPDSLDARFNLVTALAEEGRLAEALAQCDALLQIVPQNQEALALRDQLRSQAGVPKPPPTP